MSHHFYILYSSKLDRYYVGATSDLQGRLRRHLSNHRGFTGSHSDWVLVYSRGFETRKEAFTFERMVKKKNSQRGIGSSGFIHSKHPRPQSGELLCPASIRRSGSWRMVHESGMKFAEMSWLHSR